MQVLPYKGMLLRRPSFYRVATFCKQRGPTVSSICFPSNVVFLGHQRRGLTTTTTTTFSDSNDALQGGWHPAFPFGVGGEGERRKGSSMSVQEMGQSSPSARLRRVAPPLPPSSVGIISSGLAAVSPLPPSKATTETVDDISRSSCHPSPYLSQSTSTTSTPTSPPPLSFSSFSSPFAQGTTASVSSASCLMAPHISEASAGFSSCEQHIQAGLRQQLCHPVSPLPHKAVFLRLCHCCRLMHELYHSTPSRRLSKLRAALGFLRRHNVLLHGILFYAPPSHGHSISDTNYHARSRAMGTSSPSLSSSCSSSGCWNVSSEFTRLRLFGESFLHAEIRTRVLKLLPDLPTEVFVETLQRCTSPESYASLFEKLGLRAIVGTRPTKPLKLKTKARAATAKKNSTKPEEEKEEGQVEDEGKGNVLHLEREENHKNRTVPFMITPTPTRLVEGGGGAGVSAASPSASPPRLLPTLEARTALQVQRTVYRQQYSFSVDEKASMLCAIVGELRWFSCRTRPTHRTHNNAIFPPSDVLILHVLATHVVESIPAEMIVSLVQPSLEMLTRRWPCIGVSLPSQLHKRWTPSPSRYRLTLFPKRFEPDNSHNNHRNTPISSTRETMTLSEDVERVPPSLEGSEGVALGAKKASKQEEKEDACKGNPGIVEIQSEEGYAANIFPEESCQTCSTDIVSRIPLSFKGIKEVPGAPGEGIFTLLGTRLSPFPVGAHTAILSTRVQAKTTIRGIKGGAASAQFRVYTKNRREVARDMLFSNVPVCSSSARTSSSVSSPPCPLTSDELKGDVKVRGAVGGCKEGGMTRERRRELLAKISF